MQLGGPKKLYSAVIKYLTNFQMYYPGILDWFPVVERELPSGRRRLFVISDDSSLLGLAITKNGPRAKLCHISVSPSARNRGLGGTLMQHALRNMAINGATEIRVTTSEEVYRKHAFFFGAAGFRAVDWQVSRYRRDVSEVLWQRSIGVSQEPVGRSSQESRRPISYDLNDVQLAQKCPNTIAL